MELNLGNVSSMEPNIALYGNEHKLIQAWRLELYVNLYVWIRGKQSIVTEVREKF